MEPLARRSFLIGAAGLIGGGAVISLAVPRAALADAAVGKYARTILLQQELIACTSDYIAARASSAMLNTPDAPWLKPKLPAPFWERIRVNEAAGRLFAQVNGDYPLPTHTEGRQEVSFIINDILRGRLQIDTMSETGLMAMLDGAVPVAVARYVFKDIKAPVNFREVAELRDFADRHRDIIMFNDQGRPWRDIRRLYPEWVEVNYTAAQMEKYDDRAAHDPLFSV